MAKKMSWYTDVPGPLSASLERTAALLVRGSPTDQIVGMPLAWVPASWPELGSNRLPASQGETGTEPPALWFGESDLAQVGAAIAMAAARDARASCADETVATQALALQRMAVALTDAVQTRHDHETRCLRQVVDLGQAIARALIVDPDGSRAAAVVDTVRAMLATLPSRSAVRVVVASECAPMLAAALPEIAGRLGCVGALEVVGDARLPAGTVQLMWPGGWLEHAPAGIQQRLAELLTACRPAEAPTAAGTTLAPNPATDDGDDHGLD